MFALMEQDTTDAAGDALAAWPTGPPSPRKAPPPLPRELIEVLPVSPTRTLAELASQTSLDEAGGPRKFIQALFRGYLPEAKVEAEPQPNPLQPMADIRALSTDITYSINAAINALPAKPTTRSVAKLRVQVVYERAKVLQAVRRFAEAAVDMTFVLAHEPRSHHAFFHRAFCFKGMRKFALAGNDFESARELCGGDPRFILNYRGLHTVDGVMVQAGGEVPSFISRMPSLSSTSFPLAGEEFTRIVTFKLQEERRKEAEADK